MDMRHQVLCRIAGGLLAAALASGCSFSSNIGAKDAAGLYTSDSTTVQVVSALVGGKNVYIPSMIVVTGGERYTLSLYNTTDTPHGFRISGLAIETVLPPREEHRLELPVLEGGRIYHIHCQLHPGHRTGKLVVLRGR
jgi:hypothetical protein